MNNIAIITARGGSKRIPRKNIKLFNEKPIILYTIEAAIQSGIFQEVMVSTDDHEIAEVAISGGASVPFFRSEKTSGDYSTTADVLNEVLEEYAKQGLFFDNACCCYPTAPFITSDKLHKAYNMLVENNADVVLPVARYSVPIWWALKKENDHVALNWPENANKRSQDLPLAYYDCGQFYFFDISVFKQKQTLFTDNTLGLEVPESEVQDIDNEEDWKIAEIKYLSLLAKNKSIV